MLEAQIIKRSVLCSGLTPEEAECFASLAKVEHRGFGDQLIRLGECDSDLFLVIEGRGRVLTHDGDDLGEVSAGSVVGEISFLDAQPRTAHVTCDTAMTVARWPGQELRRAMSGDRSMGFILLANLARVVTTRLRSADARLDEYMDHHANHWEHAL